MAHYRIAFLGFGNVGKALAKLLNEKREELVSDYSISFSIVGVSTKSHGTAVSSKGIEIHRALGVDNFDGLSDQPMPISAIEFINRCDADVLFENTPVNYKDGQPAIDHVAAALERGMHVVTANKGPVVHAYDQLYTLGKQNERKFLFESTVMDGAPIFALFRGALPAAKLLSFSGVLNSTTNMILTRMEQGKTFDQAVEYCQQIGIAETDPSGDVDGWDAAIKVAALATVLMRKPIKPEDVERQGIRDITSQDIEFARDKNKRWKLVCNAKLVGDQVQAKVFPEMVGIESPLYGIEGTSSAVQLQTDVLGRLTLIEDNPGPHTTAYGLLADFINAVR